MKALAVVGAVTLTGLIGLGVVVVVAAFYEQWEALR